MTVKQIQHLLAYHGYYGGGVDGIWGEQSKEATKCFQREVGLEDDGVVGQRTEDALRQAVSRGIPGREKADTPQGWEEIEWFTPNEFACKCGLYHAPYCDGFPARMDVRVVNICEAVRNYFGVPVQIISGLRCPQHNADSGGVANSQHMDGTAADIRVRGIAPAAVEAFLDRVGGVRYHYAIGTSQNVHFDVSRG